MFITDYLNRVHLCLIGVAPGSQKRGHDESWTLRGYRCLCCLPLKYRMILTKELGPFAHLYFENKTGHCENARRHWIWNAMRCHGHILLSKPPSKLLGERFSAGFLFLRQVVGSTCVCPTVGATLTSVRVKAYAVSYPTEGTEYRILISEICLSLF